MNPDISKPGIIKRKAIALTEDALIQESVLQPGTNLPLVLEPSVDGFNITHWAANNTDFIMQKLRSHGGILFRGFGLSTVDEFENFLRTLVCELFDYSYRSTPRTQVSGRIYTSTEYPEHQTIPLHNEMSYSLSWPMVIGFFCLKASPEGGETPIADSRNVYRSIDPEVRDRFVKKGVMYVRNYGDSLDLPWQEVFETSDRGEVEAFCRKADIQFEWKGDDELRTSQVCQAVATHPHTGDKVWFNQAHLFHVSSLASEMRESLLASTGGEPPRNAYHGDGSPIDEDALEQIRAIYAKEAIVFSWGKGDILLLDNMLTAHGRKPYRGERRIVVGMG